MGASNHKTGAILSEKEAFLLAKKYPAKFISEQPLLYNSMYSLLPA